MSFRSVFKDQICAFL